MRRILLITAAPRAAAGVGPHRRRVLAPDRHLRGAARAALGLDAQRHARPDPVLRRHPRPPARLLARLRARRRTQDQARRLRRAPTRPPIRADKWDNLDGLVAAATARGIARHADAHRAGAAVGDAATRRTTSPYPDPAGVRRVRDRDRPPLRRQRSTRGRSGTSPTSRSSSSRSSSPARRTRRSSTASSTRRPTRASARRRPTRKDTILIGETSPRGNSNVVAPARLPARDAVPGLQVPQGEVLRRAAGRRLRAPRVHDRGRPALGPAERRTT